MEYRTNLKELFLFESKSVFGRLFLNRKPKLFKDKNYLNLGCGSNIIEGYINADFFKIFQFLKKKIHQKQWQLDLRYKLNCQNDTFNGIYSEHTLEHLYPSQVKILLPELHRIIKKNAFIRISVPDIQKYIDYYNNITDKIDIERFNIKYKTGCEAIRNITQNYYHCSVWDFEELKKYLETAGFRNVKKMKFNESNDNNLTIDTKERKWETLYIEAQK